LAAGVITNLEENDMTSNLGRNLLCALSAAAMVAACKPKDNAATDTTTSAGAVATDSAANANANRGWTDGQILAFTATANKGEISEGTLATTKATNATVKAFARQLVTDHKAMLSEGEAFATKNSITPDSTKDDVRDLMKESQDGLKDLTEKAKGADWDKEFIEHEIDGHKKVLEKVQNAAQSTTNPELKDMLTKAAGKIQEHLTKAEDIKANTLK
jgi:putative membrane protein